MKKHVRLWALLLVALMALSACDTSGGGDAAKDTVVVATADETPSINPADHNAVAGSYVNELMYNGLFALDKSLNPVPDLCESYTAEEQSDGSYLWTFKLRSGVKFHDGTTLTADDVVASLNNTKNMADVSLYADQFSAVGCQKVDDLTVTLTTAGPSASLLYDLSHHGNFIVPKSFIDNGDTSSANPIGTGPYKFVSWSRGEELKFEAHEDYFNTDAKAKIKNLTWRIIPEGSSRTIALEAGEVDYVIETDTTSLSSLEANPDISVLKVSSTSHNWLCINNEKEPFGDINVRKAINAAINKEDCIKVALNGMGIVAAAQTPLGMLGEIGEYQAGYDAYDVAKAKEYLAAWGGDPSTIVLDMICSNDTKRRCAEVIQANLKEIGINATISSMDLATYLTETAAGNFTGFIGGYTSNEMMSFLKGVFHTANIGASNKTRSGTPELDALIDKAGTTVDQAEREAVLQECTRMLNELCYQVPIYQDYTVSAHSANLKNTFITSGGSIFVNEWSWQ
jgi:peptide/nickel transport system substrate-binding protein